MIASYRGSCLTVPFRQYSGSPSQVVAKLAVKAAKPDGARRVADHEVLDLGWSSCLFLCLLLYLCSFATLFFVFYSFAVLPACHFDTLPLCLVAALTVLKLSVLPFRNCGRFETHDLCVFWGRAKALLITFGSFPNTIGLQTLRFRRLVGHRCH